MSVYDELSDCIDSAWSSDSCEYEVYSEMFDLIADAEYEYDNLKAENAQLRGLVREMFRDFASCDYQLKRHGRTFMAVTRYLDRMRELRIEADG